jgi:hypothetical protein
MAIKKVEKQSAGSRASVEKILASPETGAGTTMASAFRG